MKWLHNRFISSALVCAATFAFGGGDARADEQVATSILVYDAAGNVIGQQYAAEKGAGKHLTARVFDQNGRQMDADVSWQIDGDAGTIAKDATGATLTMTKDMYDDPHKYEPWANVRACVGGTCKWLTATGVVNLTGDWSIYIDVTNAAFGDQELKLRFTQNGRDIVCVEASQKPGTVKRPMTAKVNGKKLQFKDPSNELTAFSGALTRRGGAQGTWRSYKGYEGKWFGRK